MKNKEGLKRDIILALEHFKSRQKTKEYIITELAGQYSEEEINQIFNEIVYLYIGDMLTYESELSGITKVVMKDYQDVDYFSILIAEDAIKVITIQ